MTSRVALVTGATGGLGRAIVSRLSETGFQLSLAARRSEPLQELASTLTNPQAIFTLPTDVTSQDQVEKLVSQTLEHFGRIDVLINCAGVGILKPSHQLTEADLDTMLQVNFKGSFFTTQLVCNNMREQKSGHVLNFPGILGRHPMAMAAGYCASKFAVVGFSKCMADELKRFGVKFTLFYLGGVDSPFWDQISMKVQRDKMLSPATVAEAVSFTLGVPTEAIPNEVVLQPESHQFF
ncbi:MAG: SDR family oxidoreductase [Synechococcaceae cyanobacterium SM2_3_1]|nr:SDR family oxidoreductase [Synechococcaceae cyanobacterium SM2_3_1]